MTVLNSTALEHRADLRRAAGGRAAGDPLPPYVLRGLNQHSIGLHWLRGTVPQEREEDLCIYISEVFQKSEPVAQEWGRWRYDRSINFEPLGVTVYFDSTPDRGRNIHAGRCCLDVPGSAIDILSPDDQRQFIRELILRFHFRASRFDIAFDDYKRRVEVSDVYDCYQEGAVVGFRRADRYIGQKSPGKKGKINDGLTFGVRGSSGSGKYMRIYDKGLESEGRENFIRWELELTGRCAFEVCSKVLLCPDVPSYGGLLGAVIAGIIDFRVRAKGTGQKKNASRRERMEWWSRIVDVLGGDEIRVRGKVPEATIERTATWVRRQVSGSLAAVRKALGEEQFDDWLEAVLYLGETKMSSRHRGAVNHYKARAG